MNKKIILIGSAIGLALMAMQKKETPTDAPTDGCTYYMVDGNPICDDMLPDLGYMYWKGGKYGDGWYHYTMFENPFNFPATTVKNTIQKLGTDTLDPTNPNYNTAMNTLNGWVKSSAHILLMA